VPFTSMGDASIKKGEGDSSVAAARGKTVFFCQAKGKRGPSTKGEVVYEKGAMKRSW